MRYIHELFEDNYGKAAATLDGCPVNLNKKNRVNILALGDVGTTMLIALKLLGNDVISEIGICDIRKENTERLEIEMNQIAYPFGMVDMPEVKAINEDELFDCDVMIFCASKGVPPVDGNKDIDVRMVQLEANRQIINHYAELAKAAEYKGMVCVVSDPVDNLAVAFLDASGLKPWQFSGYGLGVMNARALYYSKKDSKFGMYAEEGRAFGPHGKDLVIANSIENYDNELSLELTRLATEANIRVRDLGFKPYIAPAVSSAAISILLTIRGEWHYSSLYMGDAENGAFMGVKNRLTETGFEYEDLPLDDKLYERINKAYVNLAHIR